MNSKKNLSSRPDFINSIVPLRGIASFMVFLFHLFCKIKCEHKCKLIPCKNNLHCKSEFPSYFFKEKNEIYGGCVECSVFNITFLNEKRICLVCSTPQYMIVTKCGHEMCFECLFDINDDIAQCPFCRTEIELK